MGLFKARSVKEISEAMQLDKEARSALDAIDTTSDAGVWPNLRESIAIAANVHEKAFVGFSDETEARALEIPTGTPRWYAAESLVFQFGDTVEYFNGNIVYAVIDTDKQIVKLAAADKENGFLVLKVAALNGDGTARPLTATELTAFRTYWADKSFACTPLAFISQSGDIARISYRIGVDASLINVDTGQLLTDPLVYPVEDAIIAFLRTYQASNEVFNSVFQIAALTDIIQAVPGVLNPVPVSVFIRPSDGDFQDILDTENKEYLSRAGYIVPDATPGLTLRTLLTYYNAV